MDIDQEVELNTPSEVTKEPKLDSDNSNNNNNLESSGTTSTIDESKKEEETSIPENEEDKMEIDQDVTKKEPEINVTVEQNGQVLVNPENLILNNNGSTDIKTTNGNTEDIKIEENLIQDDIEMNGNSEVLKRKRSTPIVSSNPPQLLYANLKTGFCYDVRMRYHAKIVTSAYDYVDPHPEDPRRIYRVYKSLAEAGLVIDPKLEGLEEVGDLMLKIPIREARDDEILLVHTKEHLEFIKSTTKMTRKELVEETEKGDSVYFNNESYSSALLSCGGAIEVSKAVVERKVKNAFAIVRPPGHHAEPGNAAGFCMFSNVAVTAKTILRDYPETVRKILVLDWDVHHGNGTQRAFYNDPRVLYISLHRYDGGKFYPGTNYASHTMCGEGPGKGFNVNIPWASGELGDADYIYAMNRVIMQIAIEYDPDLVIISSGFDAAEGDPIGGCHLSPNAYGYLTHMMKVLANGNLVVVMEGGYNLDSIAKSALAVAKVLVGEVPGRPLTQVPQLAAVQVIDQVIQEQSKYWKCMKPGYQAPDFTQAEDSEFIPEMIRSYQAHNLYNKYKMTSLPILKNKIPSTIDDQILVTPEIHSAKTLVVIVHDTPEIWAARRPILGTIDPSQSLMIDASRQIIDWATSQPEFGVLDVSVPGVAGVSHNSSYSIGASAQDLCIYLWDDYIEYFSAEKIILIGVGEAYSGLVYLAGHREIRTRVRSIIAFVDDIPLRAIAPVIDEYISDWFYHNSLIFTSHEHNIWDPNLNPKKPRRKFGRVIRSDSVGTARVARERFSEAKDYIEDSLEDEEEEESEA